MTVVALVPAAGTGARFGSGPPKQFRSIAGRTVLDWALHRLHAGGVTRFVVALPESAPPLATLVDARFDVMAVTGGASRQESVASCLAAGRLGGDDLVVVHDAARAAVHPDDVRRVVGAVADHDGAVLGRLLTDTLKRLESNRVVATVDRRGLFRAETPQAFPAAVLERALVGAVQDGVTATDEAGLVERREGASVVAVQAGHPNPKLTVPADVELLECLLGRGGAT